MKRKVLGKGLASIISNEPSTSGTVIEINLEDIHPNPFQPRRLFSEESLRELAQSLKESGLIQPVVVYRNQDHYHLIVGERRWRAAQLLGWEKIAAMVKDVTELEVQLNALVENLQREDLNALETASGIQALANVLQCSQQELADRLGMNRSTVANFLRLLRLPDTVKEWLINGSLDQGHARALLALRSEGDVKEAASFIVQRKLSVREAEKLVKQFYRKTENEKKEFDPDLQKMEDRLSRVFSTRVKLSCSPEGRGKIEVYYTSLEEFQRILSMIDNKEQKWPNPNNPQE